MPVQDKRRPGDERPFEHDQDISLTLLPAEGQPFRWLPRHGQPSCIGEWMAQRMVTATAWAPIYIAIVTTLTLLVVVFGVPFVSD
jgi:hypothetical protein